MHVCRCECVCAVAKQISQLISLLNQIQWIKQSVVGFIKQFTSKKEYVVSLIRNCVCVCGKKNFHCKMAKHRQKRTDGKLANDREKSNSEYSVITQLRSHHSNRPSRFSLDSSVVFHVDFIRYSVESNIAHNKW